METKLLVTSAIYSRRNPDLVALQFNDDTNFSIYVDDGLPRTYAHDLLDAWIAAGNSIAEAAA